MSIIRAPRPTDKFYVLDKRISEDMRLSWAARGLLVYLLGKPDQWEVSVAALVKETAKSGRPTRRDGVYSLIRELESAGYLERRQARSEGGTFDRNDYMVSEAPLQDAPLTAQPLAVKPTQVSNDLEQGLSFMSSGISNEIPLAKADASAPPPAKIPVHEIVNLYHQHLPMCPRVMKVTKARAGAIQARWRSGDLPDLETWSEYFQFVAESRFLTGQVQPAPGRRRFVADLEWLAKEGNYAKVYERKFHEGR